MRILFIYALNIIIRIQNFNPELHTPHHPTNFRKRTGTHLDGFSTADSN